MVDRIRSILRGKGFRVYDTPYMLNIVGLRNKQSRPNTFDDDLIVFWKDERGRWAEVAWKVTTDPGTYWLNSPMNAKGTAILKEGQYVDCYAIGQHQGRYEALVQVRPVTVYRDYDRNALLDLTGAREDTGNHGINIHRANRVGTTYSIDQHSAGCQVFQDAADFDSFMRLCRAHRQRHGNRFTYTLVDFRSMRRVTYGRIAKAATAITAVAVGFWLADD